MSYCRFSNADAYIFWACADCDLPSAVECCSCWLLPVKAHGFHESFRAASFTAMLDHVADHRAAGHSIPGYVDEELRADRERYNDDPTRECVS